MTIALKDFDRILAEHCAPTLKGIKAANTFKIDVAGAGRDLQKILEEYNTILNNDGIYLELIGEEDDVATVFVYNKALVAEGLKGLDVKEAFKGLDLKSDLTVDSIVSVVRGTKHQGGELPDLVKGYLDCTGENRAEYEACTRDFMAKLDQGANLMNVIHQGR
ncbi:MAG: DUF3793 family protein [Peptococcaceae bacterium]|nr:DUF3793 family protein [Peptococcaceae bacterium]